VASQNVFPTDALTIARDWKVPDRGVPGMAMLILTEAVLFAMFVAVYLVYSGKSTTGPYPKDVLAIPVISTICLLSSSWTIMRAESALHKEALGQFRLWWFITTALGVEFLVATLIEWRHLINDEHLTIKTNLFGTTYYSLVGLHATHVLVGLALLLFTLLVTLFGFPIQRQQRRIKYLGWYWHFVDAIWVVVFLTVYVVAR
jgi:cytochrome c oxidase subunit 3